MTLSHAMNEDAQHQGQGEEQIVCHNCIAVNHVESDFCRECGTPLSSFATLDPLKHIVATGDTWCKATSGPPKRITVVGMWLIFGPQLLLLLSYIYHHLRCIFWPNTMWTAETFVYPHEDIPVKILQLVLFTGLAVLYGAILYNDTG